MASQDRPGSRKSIGDVLAGRVPQFSVPDVIELGPGDLPNVAANLIKEGTVSFFLAPQGSPRIGRLREALTARDAGVILITEEDVEAAFRFVLSEEAENRYQDLDNVPMFVDIRYGSKTLRRSMIVDERIGITYGSVLYNGGDLNQSDFQVVSYSNQGIEINPEALIVISRPSLTPLEAEVLAQVPSTASEIHLSEVPEAWPVLVARVAFIVFQVAAAWGASAHGRAYDAAREWAADADRADLNRHIAQEYLAAADVNRLGIQEAAQAVQRAFDAQRLMQGVAMLDVDREHFVRAVPHRGSV